MSSPAHCAARPNPDVGACWYVVCCKPRQESIAQDNLERQNYRTYLPRLQTRKRRGGKWVETVEALFPRYLFIHVNPEEQSVAPVRSTRGAVGLLRFAGQPARVPDEIVDSIRQREDSAVGYRREGRPQFQKGATIKLIDGPLAGMEGIFGQPDGEERVVVLLDLLGKANTLAVPHNWIALAA